MFIKTVKIKSFWAGVTVLSIVAVAIIAIVLASKGANDRTEAYKMSNEHQRQEFISQLGWEVSEEYDTCRIVIIPQKFDEVYTEYNDLQKAQGFDLEDFKGKTVEIYSYPVYNYPNEQDVMMNLMVCDGRLIGGDICSVKLGGFMQGLKKAETDDSSVPDNPTSDSSSTTDSADGTDSTENTDAPTNAEVQDESSSADSTVQE